MGRRYADRVEDAQAAEAATLQQEADVSFTEDLISLQRALTPPLVPAPAAVDPRGRFWRIGTCDDVAVEVVDQSFDAGINAVSYVADHGRSIIIIDPRDQAAVTTFPERLVEARASLRFWKEQERFQARLPELMNDERCKGRWVVFQHDAVIHIDDTREQAHRWAIDNVGRLSGFVVAEVGPPRVYRVGGARRSNAR